MKRRFECPVHDDEEIENSYSTEECVNCCCFWDCATGISECLKDDDFEDFREDLEDALMEII